MPLSFSLKSEIAASLAKIFEERDSQKEGANMYGGVGLERFRKSQSLEPFSVTSTASPKKAVSPSVSPLQLEASLQQTQVKNPCNVPQPAIGLEVAAPVASGSLYAQFGGGQSTWQPPDWAVEPRTGAYYLEVLKDKEVIGQFNLDKRRHIFGRLFPMCDFVLNHDSISRQHAAVVTHKNGRIYVIDLGSVHGTFVSNERLTKDIPVELKVGQSLRFAASTRTYILRENITLSLTEDLKDSFTESNDKEESARVTFRDKCGGELSELIGISDGADVETEISPAGVLSHIGKYESLVKITVIPKGEGHTSTSNNQKGVTDKLQEVLNKVKSGPKSGGIYDDLYGESFSVKVGSSWAYRSIGSGDRVARESSETPGIGVGVGDDLFDD